VGRPQGRHESWIPDRRGCRRRGARGPWWPLGSCPAPPSSATLRGVALTTAGSADAVLWKVSGEGSTRSAVRGGGTGLYGGGADSGRLYGVAADGTARRAWCPRGTNPRLLTSTESHDVASDFW